MMDYNARMSQQFRGSSQKQKGTQKKEEDSDAFMRLVSCVYCEGARLTMTAARQGDRRMYQ